MPSVIFHASGKDFNPDTLHTVGFAPYFVHRKGERSTRGRKSIHEDSGFSVDLGPDDSEDLGRQIEAASDFLAKHHDEIENLAHLDHKRFDFGYVRRRDAQGEFPAMQGDYFEPAFLALCGKLGIGLALSLYHDHDSEEQAGPDDESVSADTALPPTPSSPGT